MLFFCLCTSGKERKKQCFVFVMFWWTIAAPEDVDFVGFLDNLEAKHYDIFKLIAINRLSINTANQLQYIHIYVYIFYTSC